MRMTAARNEPGIVGTGAQLAALRARRARVLRASRVGRVCDAEMTGLRRAVLVPGCAMRKPKRWCVGMLRQRRAGGGQERKVGVNCALSPILDCPGRATATVSQEAGGRR